jgi:hypothetical protein
LDHVRSSGPTQFGYSLKKRHLFRAGQPRRIAAKSVRSAEGEARLLQLEEIDRASKPSVFVRSILGAPSNIGPK